jgi:hypothetical protein
MKSSCDILGAYIAPPFFLTSTLAKDSPFNLPSFDEECQQLIVVGMSYWILLVECAPNTFPSSGKAITPSTGQGISSKGYLYHRGTVSDLRIFRPGINLGI